MATAVIDVVIGKLAKAVVGKLGEQIINQASILLYFKEDFEWLKKEFTKVRGYLQHEHDQNESVKKWFADVQDIAFDAEDIVEECAVQPLYHYSLVFRFKMGRRIKKLRERTKTIMEDAAVLSLVQQVCHVPQPLTSHGRAPAEAWKKSGLIERDAKPVSIDAKVQQILHLLEGDEFQVIAVLGMGGIGKTFLVQNVYNHHQVRQRFEKVIWLSVSQVFSVERLQFDIAFHLDLKEEVKGVTEQLAAELIHERLKNKSWLIVLDDVWDVVGVNNLLQRLGITSGSGKPCKVVLTTRSTEVCNIMGSSQTYQMELLSGQDSWNLFCLHAFPDDQHNRPSQQVDKVAHQVERECCRLPLAIKTVAASMANQTLSSAWESKLWQLKEVSDPEDPIRSILRLSYDALPGLLKPCFLCFSFFEEDVEIDAEYLIYLWIGEGFIPKGKEQWSTGWNYLKQLANLCLVEMSEDEDLKKCCKIHDLLLDLTIHISKANKCAFTVEEASAIGCHRILLTKKGLKDYDSIKCPPSLRTLSLSKNSFITKLPTKSLSSVRTLRVIDLSSTSISLLPRCIGDLKLLKVLNLSNTGFTTVPDCVRNLKSLFFLNVSTCSLPKWIGDLKCLQHLHVDRVDPSREISRGISNLVSLRTLRSNLYKSFDFRFCLKDVAKLIQLQELSIAIEMEEDQRNLEEGILTELVNMRHLTIYRYGHHQTFPENMKAMKDLEFLWLHGLTISRWICEYGNLRILRLWRCYLSNCPALETMPNLTKLELCLLSDDELPESFGKSGAFPQLRTLRISNCSRLKSLPNLQHGAMPRVEVFEVHLRLYKIPKGLEHLTSLKLLDLSDKDWTEEDRRESLKEGGKYWNKIKGSNPHVTIRV